MRAHSSRQLLLPPVFAFLLSTAFAQSPPPAAPAVPEPTATGTEQSLGAVARASKKQNAAPGKKVYTEDDMDALRNALPALTMDGAENGDDIVAAIGRYKQAHSPEDTEAAVQAWYDKYDEELAAAIQQNSVVSTLREENLSNGYEMCRDSGDYQTCEGRRRAEYIGQRHDQATIMKNAVLEVRIQHAFMKVRIGITQRYNLHYDWFKIRTTNGIDKF
jgi:hypothetical protein